MFSPLGIQWSPIAKGFVVVCVSMVFLRLFPPDDEVFDIVKYIAPRNKLETQ